MQTKRRREEISSEEALKQAQATAFESTLSVLDEEDVEFDAGLLEVPNPFTYGANSSDVASVDLIVKKRRASATLDHEGTARASTRPAVNACMANRTTTATRESNQPSENKREEVLRRVQAMIIQHGPLDIGQVHVHYQRAFGEGIPLKKIGFAKLKALVESIPSVDVKMLNASCIAASTLSLTSQEQFVSEMGSDGQYGCLGCGKHYAVLGCVVEHMQQCCPGNLRASSSKAKLAYQCRIGHNKCRVPNCKKDQNVAADNEATTSERYGPSVLDKRLEEAVVTALLEARVANYPDDASSSDNTVLEPLRKKQRTNGAFDNKETLVEHSTSIGRNSSLQATNAAIASRKPEPPKSKREQVMHRIHAVVIQHGPLEMGQVSQQYEESFGETIDHKSLGFGMRKTLIESVPSLDVSMFDDAWIVVSSAMSPQSQQQLMSDVGWSGVYGCLGCSKLDAVYVKVIEHMEQCCPKKLSQSKLRKKCRIEHNKCSVPSYKKNPHAPKPEGSGKLYGCLGCVGYFNGEWKRCLSHMKGCCPGKIVVCETDAFQRRCTLGDRMCDVPGHEQGSNIRYECQHCEESHSSWALCLQHMMTCCPLALRTLHTRKRKLMWKCRVQGDDNWKAQRGSKSASSTSSKADIATSNEGGSSVSDHCFVLDYVGDHHTENGSPNPEHDLKTADIQAPQRDPLLALENSAGAHLV